MNRHRKLFSQRKNLSKPQYPQLLIINVPVGCSSVLKHLDILLDEEITFAGHVKAKIQKAVISINVTKN